MNPNAMYNGESELNRQNMLDLLANGKLYLFAGAGLSCRAGMPSWKVLLKECADAYKAQHQHSPERAAEIERFATRENIELFEVMLNDLAGEDALIEVFKRHFAEKACDPLHERLLRLPFCGWITSNYDRCFEAACDRVHERIDLIGDRWFCFPPCHNQLIDIESLFSGDPFLLHIHGCFWQAGCIEIENLILTRSQYRRFYYEERAMQDILARLSDRHLLLIGTSFTDQYFLDALAKYRRPTGINERANMPDWYILYDNAGQKDIYPIRDRENYRLHHIYYTTGSHQDGFAGFIDRMLETIARKEHPLRKLSDSDLEGLGGPQ